MFYSDIESMRLLWNETLKDSSKNSIFNKLEYVLLWYRCFLGAGSIRVLSVTSNNKIIGIFPMVCRRFLGIRTLNSLTNRHCLLNSKIYLIGHEDEFWNGIKEKLLEHSHEYDLMNFQFQYSFESDTPSFMNKMHKGFNSNTWIKTQPTYLIALPNSYEEYFKEQLSKSVRKNILYYHKRLEKGGIVEYRNYSGKDAIGHWEKFLKLEDSGWKGSDGSSILRLKENYKNFYDGFVQLLGKLNVLHLYFLILDGVEIAGVFGFEDCETFHYAKTGYDEKYGEFSPSNLLLVHIVEDLIVNRPDIKQFHMFPWDYGYKHRFANEISECTDAIIYSSTMLGQMVKKYQKIKSIFRKLYF
jgi:CelD/BcsL family acetyltransferase involved in cellulose biosynthesis